MAHVVTRVVGALLALVGLALAVVGVWFATELGGAGTATFTAHPRTGDPVVVPPDVLNRVDADVTVRATPSSGGRVWMALANPSDATAVLGDSRHVEVTGVSVSGWTLTTVSGGSADPADLPSAELWRNQDDDKRTLAMTVEQADAPETVIVAAEQGTVETVTLTIANKTWFVESVVAAIAGVFLLVVGLVVAWPRRRRSRGSTAHPAAVPQASPAGVEEPVEGPVGDEVPEARPDDEEAPPAAPPEQEPEAGPDGDEAPEATTDGDEEPEAMPDAGPADTDDPTMSTKEATP